MHKKRNSMGQNEPWFDPDQQTIEIAVKILDFYLACEGNRDERRDKVKEKILAAVKGDLLSLQQGLVFCDQSRANSDPFFVLVEQLVDTLTIIDEANRIAHVGTFFLYPKITQQPYSKKVQLEAALLRVMTLSGSMTFDKTLEWILQILDILVKDSELRQALQSFFEGLRPTVKLLLSRYYEFGGTGPLPSVSGVPFPVFETPNKRKIPFKTRTDLEKFWAFMFAYFFFRTLACYVTTIKIRENPDGE